MRRRNKTASGMMALLAALSRAGGKRKKRKGTSLTTNISCAENKMTMHKCQEAQADPLLCQNGHKEKEQTTFARYRPHFYLKLKKMRFKGTPTTVCESGRGGHDCLLRLRTLQNSFINGNIQLRFIHTHQHFPSRCAACSPA